MPSDTDVMTVEMKVNLLAPASGLLRAEGRVVRAGRRIVIVTAEVLAGGRVVALMQGTMIAVTAAPPGGDCPCIVLCIVQIPAPHQ